MTKITVLSNDISDESGLLPIFEDLKDEFGDVSNSSYEELETAKVKPSVIVTDMPNYLLNPISNSETILLLTNATTNIVFPSVATRRNFTNPLKKANSVFAFSKFSAKSFELSYKIKPIVQLPIIRQYYKLNEGEEIITDNISSNLEKEIKRWKYSSFFNVFDFERAKLYLDNREGLECVNYRLCIANAHGVPCVVINANSNLEFAGKGDVVLPKGTPPNKWLDAIKRTIRDCKIKRKENEKSSLRFRNNMDRINRQIERITNRKRNSALLPKIASQLQQERALSKIEDLNAKRRKNNPNSKVTVKKNVMGRRERLIERERRIKRRLEKEQEMIRSSSIPTFKIVDTPSWFTSKGECDVSIIIPMYKSRSHIQKQIKQWDLEDDGLKKEIIYVDDLCPQRSHQAVLPAWEENRQHLKNRTVGKIICSDVNRGYGENCNLGAKHASGKYFIFLNADAYVLPNWVKPMFDLCEQDPEIGIVGNMHLKHRGKDALVDSAGSEWHWTGGHFEHIGRSSFQAKRINEIMKLNNIPKELQKPGEREMVTGCCFMISRKVFYEIGGYDEVYKIGYWEDSDMNMSVKEKGYKVFFTPYSKIIHDGGHSRSHNHVKMKQNRQRFFFRWVDTGFVDKIATQKRPASRGKPEMKGIKDAFNGNVTGCVIACNEEEFLEASVKSISSMCDNFVFVIGGNQYAHEVGMCNEKGLPTDKTLDIARSLAKEFNGIVIEPPGRCWHGKTEMRNAYVEHLKPNDWMFMLDGDEVYKPGQLWVIAKLMQQFECLRLHHHVFWNNIETIGVGTWEKYPQERIVKWKKGYHYEGRNHLSVADKNNKDVAFRVPTYHNKEKLFYHYSWVRPIEKIRQKLAYYEVQLKKEWGEKSPVNKNYVNDIFLKWRKNPNAVEYTHPRGGGQACPFFGIHPYEVTQLIDQGKLNFK